jgi:hypothetical protein
MKKLLHKTCIISMSIGMLFVVILAFWLLHVINAKDYSQFDSREDKKDYPLKFNQTLANISIKDSNVTKEQFLTNTIKDTDLPGFNFDIGEELRTAKAKRIAEREEQLSVEVSKESTAEKVRNLLYKTSYIGDMLLESDFTSGIRYISTLQDNPRVKSLVELATNGSQAEKKEIYNNLVKMCHVYLEELPLLLGDPNDPWRSSVMHPGGGSAFPYLLTYVDGNASTLGLLAKMYLRLQNGLKLYHQLHYKVDVDEWISSKQGLIFAYACDHFLDIYSRRLDLQEQLSAQQSEVLKKYAEHRKSRPKNWNIELNERTVMEFAVAFVESETKGNNEGK